jgi:hypothetical protein
MNLIATSLQAQAVPVFPGEKPRESKALPVGSPAAGCLACPNSIRNSLNNMQNRQKN